jgi:hypothetical protein
MINFTDKTDTKVAVWEAVSCAAIHTRGVRVHDRLGSDICNAALILGRYYVMRFVVLAAAQLAATTKCRVGNGAVLVHSKRTVTR